MILIVHAGTGERQVVGGLTGYGADWSQLGPELPAGEDPRALVLQGDAWGPDLVTLRARMVARVDAEAEDVRARFLTPGAGQALTYQRKEAEARAWSADRSSPTPFLAAEAQARNLELAALAAEVIAQADAWTEVGAAIEGKRMGAKVAIAEADTPAAIEAVAFVDWQQILLLAA